MTTHRLINVMLVIAILATMTGIQFLDASDIETEQLMSQEQREWMHAIQHCHRSYGPQTQPEYDEQNRLVCVGARGQIYQGAKN